MNVELSDLLTCPRCGPGYGLVLLPREREDRRVLSGVLGCANCRERYAIEGGVADLRVPGAAGPGGAAGDEPVSDTGPGSGVESVDPAVRLAGLMGLAEARGTVLVAGPAVAHASALAELLDEVEVVAVPHGEGAVRVAPGVSPMRVGPVLPLRTGSLMGVTLTGRWAESAAEGARVLGPSGRLVLDPAPHDAEETLAGAGLVTVAREANVLVAARHA